MPLLNRLSVPFVAMQAMTPLSNETAAGEPSVFRELWDYLVEKYFTLDFASHEYPHFTVGEGTLFSLRTVLVALFVGVILAVILAAAQKRALGGLIRAMEREQCHTPEKAMTLEQLGLARASAIRQSLRHGTTLHGVVRCVEKDAYEEAQAKKREEFQAARESGTAPAGQKWKDIPFSYDFSSCHFYLPEEARYCAEVRFDRKGTNPVTILFTIIGAILLLALLCFLIPELLQLADNLIGFF